MFIKFRFSIFCFKKFNIFYFFIIFYNFFRGITYYPKFYFAFVFFVKIFKCIDYIKCAFLIEFSVAAKKNYFFVLFLDLFIKFNIWINNSTFFSNCFVFVSVNYTFFCSFTYTNNFFTIFRFKKKFNG